jgi:DNA-binding NtrC family response regulator
MHRQPQVSTNGGGNLIGSPNSEFPLPQSSLSLKNLSKSQLNSPIVAEARIASLKVLALTLLRQVESLEMQIAAGDIPELNLQQEVHRFEAAIIRSALAKTGGRQRRAAQLLGVKVTTLNTKIKRLRIGLDEADENANNNSSAPS